MNERVVNTFLDVPWQQSAVAQNDRTQWVPGKATATQEDMFVERDFRIPTGNPVFDGPGDMKRVRVFRVGRGSICDSDITADAENFELDDGAPEVDGRFEDKAGYDWQDGEV